MSGFELRAKFYPLVPTLAQLVEEAQDGVDYEFPQSSESQPQKTTE